MELKDEILKNKIVKRAVIDIVKSCNLHKLDYFSLPKDIKDSMLSIYISGATGFYEITRGAVKHE